MSVTVKNNTGLIVPRSVRHAGIKAGERVEFRYSKRRSEITRGDYVILARFPAKDKEKIAATLRAIGGDADSQSARRLASNPTQFRISGETFDKNK